MWPIAESRNRREARVRMAGWGLGLGGDAAFHFELKSRMKGGIPGCTWLWTHFCHKGVRPNALQPHGPVLIVSKALCFLLTSPLMSSPLGKGANLDGTAPS